MDVVVIALAVLLAVAFAGAGVPKVLAHPVMVDRAQRIPLSPEVIRFIVLGAVA